MDKDLVRWKNQAGEAERKRIAAENRALKLQNQLAAGRKALDEAVAIFSKLKKADIYNAQGELVSKDHKTKFHQREFIQAENMMRRAFVSIEPQKEVGEKFSIPSEPPDDPQTNDHYFDGIDHWWFYLGRWHMNRKDDD